MTTASIPTQQESQLRERYGPTGILSLCSVLRLLNRLLANPDYARNLVVLAYCEKEGSVATNWRWNDMSDQKG